MEEKAKNEGADLEKKEAAGNLGSPGESAADSVQDQESETTAIMEAKAVVEQLKQQNKRMEDNIKRAEKLAQEQILSGRSPAGAAPATQEEKEILEARKILAGTGYDELLFPQRKK